MHSYLRAVGFSNVVSRKELDKIIGIVMDKPTEKYTTKISPTEMITEVKKDFGEGIGVSIRGVYDEKGFFYMEHYFPYYTGKSITAKEDITINKRVDTDAYTGMCDDLRLGVSLIFYLQNSIEFIQSKFKEGVNRIMPLALTALSVDGRIILGIDMDERQLKAKKEKSYKRNKMIMEAKEGSQEAIDNLTIEDIDVCAMVARRIKKEDICTIVDTTFIPYGSESDNYQIMGTILSWKLIINKMTGEELYQLLVCCNHINFPICINKRDLLGEPMVGRRFRGNIWIQGRVDFNEISQ